MAAYDSLKSLVQQAIRTNGNNEITGQVLQNVLMAMIDELGGENGYAGVATPSTNPGAPDGKVFYFATEAGTYTHFDGATLAKGIHLLVFNGVTWSHQTLYTIDSEVTSGSNNLITSGAVYTKIINAINALNATVSKSAGADGLSLSITETNGKVTSISGSIAPQTYDAYGAASAAQIAAATYATNKVNAAKTQILGDAASDYNTLGKLEDKIQAEASRAAAAESALNTAKANKATTLAGYGINDAYTKTEVNGLVSTPHQNYVTVPTYASLPATGSADTIYRVSNYNGSTSQVDASVYSEYAWNGSGYTFLRVVSQIGEVFDITVYNSNTKYADLAAALGTNGANVPSSIRRGGMSVKFVQSSDNKYVQYLYTGTAVTGTPNPFLDVTNWQKVNLEDELSQLGQKVDGNVTKEISWSNGYVQASMGVVKISTVSKFSQPFLLKAGEKVTIGTQNSNIGIICSTNADSVAVGDTVTVIKRTSSSGQFETYEYTAEADIKIVLCVLASNYNLSFYDGDNLTEKVSNSATKQELDSLDQEVDDFKLELEGGKKYYANQEFDVQNTWINYTMNGVVLSEPIDFPFKYKFSTPEGVNITSFGVRVYEEDGVTYHNYPASVAPNEEGIFTSPAGATWKVSKIAINQVTPDIRYTGEFGIKVWKELEGKLNEKVDKTSIVQTTGADTDKIMSQKAVTDVVTPIAEDVHNLDQAVNGGEVVYADGTFTANNTWINYTMNGIELSEPIDFPFKYKFSTPEGVDITSFGVRVYEEDGVTHHNYPASVAPNEEGIFTSPAGATWKVSKIAINQVTPDIRYTGEFGIKVWKEQDATLATKAELQAVADAVDFDERETIPDYYFANDYLDGKVTFIRNLLEGCMANGDAFFFQTDEHWEMNAQHSPALVKYIADRLNISRLFDGGDTTHNIDAYGFYHTNPAAIDFNSLRAKTYKGNIFHTIGNHEYLTWAYTNIAQYSGVDFGNWHDFLYYQQHDRIVYGDSDKHYYYVDNYQKKIRYIILSSFKKKETPIESGGKYYTIAEYDYSTEQLEWFENTALDVEDGWTIIVFSHNFIGYNHGNRDGEGYIESVSPYVPDTSKPFAQAILQYNGAGTIAAVFAGHWHSDAVLSIDDTLAGLSASPTGKTFPCIVTTCDAYNFNGLGEEERLYNRTVDTITEQAFDVVVLDKTARKFTLVRIGGPAYNILVQAPNGKYPLFGDLEYREVTY